MLSKKFLLLALVSFSSFAFAGKELDRLDCVAERPLNFKDGAGRSYVDIKTFTLAQNYNKNYATIIVEGKKGDVGASYSRGDAGVINYSLYPAGVTLRPMKTSGLLPSKNKALAYAKYTGNFSEGRGTNPIRVACSLQLVFEK